MEKFVIKLNDDDKYSIDYSKIVYLEDSKTFRFTFWDESYKKVIGPYKQIALDLLYISLSVFYIDRIVKRDTANDSWSREIEIYMPVLEIEKWNNSKQLLEKMLKFLSGDIWKFKFRERILNSDEKKMLESIERSDDCVTKVCMFSGGLDSYVGIIDLLESEKDKTEKDLYFISHYGGGKGTVEFQEFLRDDLIKEYDLSKKNFFSFYAAAINGTEDTTRTRSFMFFAHAIAVASCNNKVKELIIPENGLISLNIPLTYSRLGTSSTRTTHPEYISYLQQLIINIGLDIKILNPYQFYTKGQMIKNCKNIEMLKKNITKTMSCSHPDSGRMKKETKAKHCGTCLPCIVRRAAIKEGIGLDETEYLNKDFLNSKVAHENLKSYKLGIIKFNEENAAFEIVRSGKINYNFEKYRDLYIQGIKELSSLINEYK